MNFLTDFADQAVVLPLVVVIASSLALQGWRRGAVVWFTAIAGTFGVMLALKLFFIGCQGVFGPIALRSPSGHVAAASVVVGGLLALSGRGRGTVALGVLMAAVMIGLTRLGLGAHTLPEVVLGGGVGLIGALLVGRYIGPVPALRARPLILASVTVLALFHGRHLEAEAAIRQAATGAGVLPAWCQPGSADRS